MRKIHLANEKKRDAEVGFERKVTKAAVSWHSPAGKTVDSARFLESTRTTSLKALQEANKDLAAALTAGDPEVDLELAGKRLSGLQKVYLRPDGNVAHAVTLTEHIFAADGTEKGTRPVAETSANIALEETPVAWSGKTFPRKVAIRKFVFARSYQLCHVNGLTYDFLFDMAKKLADADALMLVGGGPKGIAPLVFSANGTAYRGFLEGRVSGEKYTLILHLTNLELKEIPHE